MTSTGATGQANQALGNIYGGQLGMESPYLQTGQAGTNALANQVANPFQAPTAAQAEATPGYQFRLRRAFKASNSSSSDRWRGDR